jgi:hypothetical protein
MSKKNKDLCSACGRHRPSGCGRLDCAQKAPVEVEDVDEIETIEVEDGISEFKDARDFK